MYKKAGTRWALSTLMEGASWATTHVYYVQHRRRGGLVSVGGFCREVFVSCKHHRGGNWVDDFCTFCPSTFTHGSEEALASSPEPELGKALPIFMGLRHWDPWHGCDHTNHTHSLRTLSVPYMHTKLPWIIYAIIMLSSTIIWVLGILAQHCGICTSVNAREVWHPPPLASVMYVCLIHTFIKHQQSARLWAICFGYTKQMTFKLLHQSKIFAS